MSAVLVDKVTIDEIVSSLVHYGLVDNAMADSAGQVLSDENRRSLIYHDARPAEPAELYTYTPVMATRGQRARSLTDYAHQSCEHPGWTTSEARAMVLRLAFAMIAEIPGYDEAVTR